MEVFRFEHGFQQLNLSVGKLVSFMLGEGRARLHSMYASGTSGKPNPVLHNLWVGVRENPRRATLRVANMLLYGADYDDADDAQVEACLQMMREGGVPPALSQQLSFAEAVLAVRTGAMPARLGGGLLEVCCAACALPAGAALSSHRHGPLVAGWDV